MKSVIKKILLVVFIVLSFSCSGIFLYKYLFTNDAHMMSYKDKIEYVKSIKGKKAVFIGGSGTHFGISAKTFEDSLGISSANVGLHASISMDTYIQTISDYLNKGDVLFIIPEYDYYCTEWNKFDSQNIEFALFYNHFQPSYIFESFDVLPNIIYTGWYEWANMSKQIVSLTVNGKTTEAYNREDNNKWGDYTQNKGTKKLSSSVETFKDLDYNSMECLVKQIHCLEEKGIVVYLLFPPYVDYAFESNAYIIHQSYIFLKHHGIKLLYTPENTKYPLDYFYDTVYHLNEKGRSVYMDFLIKCYREQQ